MNQFKRLSPEEENRRRAAMVSQYQKTRRLENRRLWWLHHIRNGIREGRIQGSAITEAYWQLFKDAEGYQYLKSLIK